MSEVLEFAARLSKVVGARPAGTEEEQQASFFIEEAMAEAGLETEVEEFNCNPNFEMPKIACCIATIVLAILAICLPLMVVPALLISAAAAVFYILEALGYSPLTNATKGGVSQNVIAKYYPGMIIGQKDGEDAEGGSEIHLEKIDGKSSGERHRNKGKGGDARAHRKRKIVILARYDSGRVRAELKSPLMGYLDKIHWAEMGGMVLVPIALLLRLATGAGEEGHIAWDIIVGIGAFLSLLPVVVYIMHQTAAYNEGANNNASGVAVMVEVAKRIAASAKPSLTSKVISDADGLSFSLPVEEQDPTVISAIPDLSTPNTLPILHGKDAVADSGVLPVDTDLIYEEAAQGSLKNPEEEFLERNEGEDGQNPDATVAFIPVEHGRAESEGSPSHPVRNGRQSALSLETQMQSASLEFAKYDESKEDEKNPWIRLQNQSAQDARPGQGSKGDFAPAGVTADLRGPQIAASVPEEDPNVPDWFKKGKAAANAHKTDEDEQPVVQRSRFGDALDAAHETSAQAIEAFGEKGQEAEDQPFGVDRARIDELHSKIMGESADGQSAENSAEAKAERRAKLIAARDAKNAEKEDIASARKAEQALAEEELLEEKAVASEVERVAEAAAVVDSHGDVEAQNLAHAAEEVAEQAAVADRTISFIPVAADIPQKAIVAASEEASQKGMKKTAEEILDDAASLTGSRKAVSANDEPSTIGRRSISLPSLTVSKSKNSAVQNAPLADDAERGKGEGRTALKNVGGENEYGSSSRSPQQHIVKEGVSQSLEGATTSFLQENAEADALAALSSLDGSAASGRKASAGVQARQGQAPGGPSAQSQADASKISVSTAGSFVQSSQTSNFEPVGDELIANMGDGDIIIEDVDDSDYTDNVTHTGAIAGPGYVEMPKSRISRIKSIFGKKKSKDDSMSFSDAVGIEGDFDAREVGKARGGWESFKSDSVEFAETNVAQSAKVQSAPKESGSQVRSSSSPDANSQNISDGRAGAQGRQAGSGQAQAPLQGQMNPQAQGQPAGQAQGQMQPRMAQGQGQPMQGQPMQQPRGQQMPMQGNAPIQGQPMPQRQMPMQGQPQMQGRVQNQMPAQYGGQQTPMQGQPQGQMQGQAPNQRQGQPQMQGQGARYSGQTPMQGNMPMQPGAQQMPMQGQPQMQGCMQNQMPMHNQGQMPMQGQPSPQQNMGQPYGAFPQGQQPQQGAPAPSQGKAQGDIEVEETIERATKKSHSFSFFRKRSKDGDMNSGAFDDDEWNGGAFSLGRDKDSSDGGSRQRSQRSQRSSRGTSRNDGHSGRRRSADEVLAESAPEEYGEELAAQDMLDERDQIRNFRTSGNQMTSFEEVAAFASSFSKQAANEAGYDIEDAEGSEEEPDIGFQTEVWFVALGAELANNAGAKNLLAEHGDELRGAIVIDIDALGAGDLSIIEEEGVLKRVKSSTRMRRYATKAASSLGIKLGTGKMLWRESAAYFTTKRGLLTMHLCGMLDGKPAYVGEIDDTFDKLDEEVLLKNAAFMLELVNAI